MRALYSKAEGHTGVLALNLHIIRACTYGIKPPTEIAAETMQSAISLMKFYIGQTKLLYSTMTDEIAPHLVKVIELSNRLANSQSQGWIKARDIQQVTTRTKKTIWAEPKQITADQARSWMREAEALGKGVTKGTGIHIEFNAVTPKTQFVGNNSKTENVGVCRQMHDNSPTGETDTTSELQDFVDFVGKTEEKINNKLSEEEKKPDKKNPDLPTKSTKSSNPLPEEILPVDELPTKCLQNLQNDFIPLSVQIGNRVLIHALGSGNNNRAGIISHIRKLRDGRNEICTNEDGSLIMEAIVKLDPDAENAADQFLNVTFCFTAHFTPLLATASQRKLIATRKIAIILIPGKEKIANWL